MRNKTARTIRKFSRVTKRNTRDVKRIWNGLNRRARRRFRFEMNRVLRVQRTRYPEEKTSG